MVHQAISQYKGAPVGAACGEPDGIKMRDASRVTCPACLARAARKDN